jgi:type IV pilus assembly protein PilN
MRISVNLASRPFVELRPFFARLRILMVILALVAIGLGVGMHFEQQKLTVAEEAMAKVHRGTVAAQTEKRQNEARMQQPANSNVLARAHFLNALFAAKSFSWTAVMMDLENVLPTGVQVTSIEPAITPEHDLIIRLRVAGDRDRAVQLVRNLEHSSRFVAARLTAEITQTKEKQAAAAAGGAPPGGVEFEITANYNPLPEVVEAPADKADKGKIGAASDRAPVKKDAGTKSSDPRIKWAKHPDKPGPNDGIVLKPFSPAKPAGGTR